MTTMSEQEIMNSTADQIDEWFYEDSNILDACNAKEDQMYEIYGEGNYMCPYYIALMELAVVNQAKGWTKEELLRDLSEYLAKMEETDAI